MLSITQSERSHTATLLKEATVFTSNLVQPASHTAPLLKESPVTTSELAQSARSHTTTLLKELPVSTSNLIQSDPFPNNRTDELSKPSSIDSLNTLSQDRQQSQLVIINEHPKIRDFAFEPRLDLPHQVQSHRPFRRSISSSRSTTLPPRLPRYLGNHKSPTVSTLGRSVSLELPALRAAYLPRRAISLPRITEYSRTALSTRFISNQVGESDLLGTSIVRRESRGRNPKIAVATPLHIVRTRTQLHTSTMASVDSAERKEQLMLNLADMGLQSASSLAAAPATTVPTPPQALGPKEHGRWCRFKAWAKEKRHGMEEVVEDEGEEEEEGEGAA
ncbi:hypothetical protein MMC27_008744 [Xylographa pallens]|nr:hypothetical protein [Xylographa pallens]